MLIASDVAARGLDIPAVAAVIHYHVPKTAEVYVHRSGRAGRGGREGLSVLLVDPQDAQSYRRLCRNLSRPQDLPVLPLHEVRLLSLPFSARPKLTPSFQGLLEELTERVQLATELESMDHRVAKFALAA